MIQRGFSVATHQAFRVRLLAEDPDLDEETLADTLEGLTDLHDIVAALIRSALCDEALAEGLRGRIGEMESRLGRLEDRASKRRQIASDMTIDTDIKKITAPDFTISIRSGSPNLVVVDEAAIPENYWEPRAPKLNRQALLAEGRSNMTFSDKQIQALKRDVKACCVRTRQNGDGRELSYIEGWHAIGEAN